MSKLKKLVLSFMLIIGLSGCTVNEALYVVFHPIGGDDLVNEAHRVVACESGYNPNAVSPGGANHGLFQINNIHASKFPNRWWRKYEPLHNATMARDIYLQQGWGPWSCRP